LRLRVPHAPHLRVGFLNSLSQSPFPTSQISNPKFEISAAVAAAVAFAFFLVGPALLALSEAEGYAGPGNL
jgi:hypothetical protein